MRNIEKLGGYLESFELFDLVVNDMNELAQNVLCRRLVSQQIASADSICSNIEEGYGRGSSRDYARFPVIARGSAQETSGRYRRMKRWIMKDFIDDRPTRRDEIIGILTGSIKSLHR